MNHLHRRTFLAAAATGVAVNSFTRARAAEANSEVVLALMGANSRGSQLAAEFAQQNGCRIAYVCDPDERAIAKGIEAATSQGASAPKGIRDFRQALDDPGVDALVCAAPNHWHAAATTLACAAGKHVYVEKPCSHTAEEGELMIAAARTASRVVQVGTQRRSGPLYQQVAAKVREGAIGEPLNAKAWYYSPRPTIGRGRQTDPPPWLDYSLWQGPAPERPFRDNTLHYNWHFFWHWGDGELGNNGVHTLDLCRWFLGVDFPTRVTAAGARLRYDDDQETPDTLNAIFECGDKLIAWEGNSWIRPDKPEGGIGVDIRGTEGTLHVDDSGCQILDSNSKVVDTFKGGRGDAEHLRDFLDAVHDGSRTNADVEEGHKSALLCHLGNIAYRTGQSIEIDAATGHIRDNPAAQALWSREYRDGWAPKVHG